MATNFGDLLTILQDEMHITDATAQRRALARALKHYRGTKFLCSERTASMELRSGVTDYGAAEGLPGDLIAINAAVVVQNNSVLHDLQPVSIQQMRELRTHQDLLGYPDSYCLFGQKLLLYPGPSSDMTLQLDIRCDCGRDEKTGVEIGSGEESDEFTNEMIRRGEEMVLSRACYSYFLGKAGSEKKAKAWKILELEARQSMLAERDAQKLAGGGVVPYL